MAGDVQLDLRSVAWKPYYSWETDDPLHDFYIPALSRSVSYDRKAGFFSTSAMAVAAQGIASLISNGGRMRLLVGCQLSPRDVEAIDRGYDLRKKAEECIEAAWVDPADSIQKDRLAAVAWMVARGVLDVKVAIPMDSEGRPLSGADAEGIFHQKCGIFTDSLGNSLGFNGSVNESAQAWLRNIESFHVYRSWDYGAEHLTPESEEFDLVWQGRGRRTRVVDLPEAIKEKLLTFAPTSAPKTDPLERAEPLMDTASLDSLCERWLFQFLRDAPFLEDGGLVGERGATVRPWPHQERVIQELVSRYPERFLLCDEVGLGKTIEAAAALRRLWVEGTVRRCLILVPKAVLKQWHEELHEKLSLSALRYENGMFVDPVGREYTPSHRNTWESHRLILASSHLVKRRNRREELLRAQPWDLVIVDEAHHARRTPADADGSPNNLLQLLTGPRDHQGFIRMPGLADRAKCIWLLTATPMQLSPYELWDLLSVVGLGGHWASGGGEPFVSYFEQLRLPPDEMDLGQLLAMTQDYFRFGGQIDNNLENEAKRELGPVAWKRIRTGLESGSLRPGLETMDESQRAYLVTALKRHTPVGQRMFRNTRPLLRHYRELGLISQRIPNRKVTDAFVDLRATDERPLYDRIERYIRDNYNRALRTNDKGLGFVMTIYRRRLTSSLYAIRQSLERRLRYLAGDDEEPGVICGVTEEDREEDELASDVDETLEDETGDQGSPHADEIAELREFIAQLSMVGTDTKFERLSADLHRYFFETAYSKAIVFTQYTDTMDYLRKELATIYGSQVGCYSGRGGEYLDAASGAWRTTSKEDIKNRFRDNEIKMLVCTDAASEGLNLQTCGLLINYDMPWNPMRAEQRIGRVDRIGQTYSEVHIHNYFYADTVEAKVYQRLRSRIDWFEWVVGNLQPILSRLASAIEQAALAQPGTEEAVLQEVLDRIEEQLDRAELERLNLEDYAAAGIAAPAGLPPVEQADLESILTTSGALAEQLRVAEDAGVYSVRVGGETRLATFRPELYDDRPDSLTYLSYGEPMLEGLLARVPEPELNAERLPVVRVVAERNGTKVVEYCWVNSGGERVRVRSAPQLRGLFDEARQAGYPVQEVPAATRQEIELLARQRAEGRLAREERALAELRGAREAGHVADASRILQELLGVEYARRARGQATHIPDEAVALGDILLDLYQQGRAPYKALADLAGKPVTEYAAPGAHLRSLAGRKQEALAAMTGNLAREAEACVQALERVRGS